MNQRDGFVSANIHRSTRVINYAQWSSRAAFETMLNHPDAQPHLQRSAEIATSITPITATVTHSTIR